MNELTEDLHEELGKQTFEAATQSEAQSKNSQDAGTSTSRKLSPKKKDNRVESARRSPDVASHSLLIASNGSDPRWHAKGVQLLNPEDFPWGCGSGGFWNRCLKSARRIPKFEFVGVGKAPTDVDVVDDGVVNASRDIHKLMRASFFLPEEFMFASDFRILRPDRQEVPNLRDLITIPFLRNREYIIMPFNDITQSEEFGGVGIWEVETRE
ncbi:hypothetical protein R1sor_006874 [Riccia sorocarpa]|uniref:Uncharacterized protein n=1 Tax=Riccia sorocarpa TaxID=122646 RepID=A0ABD3HPA5_9MARC